MTAASPRADTQILDAHFPHGRMGRRQMNVMVRALVAGATYWFVLVFMDIAALLIDLSSRHLYDVEQRLALFASYGVLAALASAVSLFVMYPLDRRMPALWSTAVGGFMSYVVTTFAHAAMSGYGGGIVLGHSIFTIPFALILLTTAVAVTNVVRRE